MKNEQRIVLITGGNSGIGKAIAQAFVADSKVIIVGRNEERLQSAVAELGDNCKAFKADVSQRKQIEEIIKHVGETYGRLDVLVNNAGFVEGTLSTMELTELEQAWDAMCDTILKGSFLLSHAAAQYLAKPGGRIINISSIAALTGGRNPGAAGYAAAKAGLHGLTYGVAKELSPQGITVNSIAPGFIADTLFTGHWSDTAVQGIVQQTPVGRSGNVNDIAATARYLASQEASFVTGQVINVNGGWLFGRG
ncbi:SDR family NAD(P)-dependent oxidoreductase [Bacillus horti]|uniref:3-oxoacyl-[acyl-carrier protein] reductase n=1 Tax=Caldalkalibacillus horti TaxID=77523 RepID=A0ABT9VZX1_9BACI|nr:SDR family oxidoreductase [Bacillus horti]MDQ0166533.1 3-oxoacyl-[acyl-carrier protein] reductase [Bacillus horti]